MKENSYISIDLETTGLDPKRDRIIEIGAVKIKEGKQIGTFSTFVNPKRPLPSRIVELTGITEGNLKDAPVISEIFPKLLDFLGTDILLGHCILFDYSFLKQEAVNEKIPFQRKGIDTLKISRQFLPELEHRNLEYLCEYFQIEHHAHRALEDAIATHKLYKQLEQKFDSEELFSGKPLIYKVKRETPITIPQKEQLHRLVERYKLEPEIPIEELTRSEASRYLNQILEAYER